MKFMGIMALAGFAAGGWFIFFVDGELSDIIGAIGILTGTCAAGFAAVLEELQKGRATPDAPKPDHSAASDGAAPA